MWWNLLIQTQQFNIKPLYQRLFITADMMNHSGKYLLWGERERERVVMAVLDSVHVQLLANSGEKRFYRS